MTRSRCSSLRSCRRGRSTLPSAPSPSAPRRRCWTSMYCAEAMTGFEGHHVACLRESFIGGCCPLHPGEILRGWQPLHPPVGLPGPHPGFLSFHDERNQRRARGCAPWTPLGGIIIPPAARAPLRGVAASPRRTLHGGVGGGAGLRFPPRWIRDRAIKGRVITKHSLI